MHHRVEQHSAGVSRYGFGIDNARPINRVALPLPSDYTADCSVCGRQLRGGAIHLVEGAADKAWLLAMCDPCLAFAEKHQRLYKAYTKWIRSVAELRDMGEPGSAAPRKKARREDKAPSEVPEVENELGFNEPY